jgi:probable HAF family extracellular repeat protein
MKATLLKSIAAIAALAALPISLQLAAQDAQSAKAIQVHYSVINLGTLGGSASNGYGGPNDRGWVTGDANLAGDQNEHAFLWRDGVMTDLGTLGGPNSSVASPVKDEIGLIVGFAQTATVDPFGEFWGATYFCTALNCLGWQYLQRGFVWHDGVMTALPTLGGNNDGALGANNLGQVVGVAETAMQDSNCISAVPGILPRQQLDFSAVIWGPEPGQIQVLPAFPDDSVAAALAINDNGQVVGTSGVCEQPGFLAFGRHAVLWQHGTVTDLGTLGGMMFNAGNAINNKGQVVGQSDLPGDTATHAFFWQNDKGMIDLGTLPTPNPISGMPDSISIANDINEKGQVVGASCDANFNCRPFLWENGVMKDLNKLIDSSLYLTFGSGINNRGEITGSAFDPNTGIAPAFLAIPCDESHASYEGCADSTAGPAAAAQAVSERPRVILPEGVRGQLQKRRGLGSLAGGPVTPQ